MQIQAERAYPEECCGLLLGFYAASLMRAQVQEVRPVANTWTQAVNPFADGDQTANAVSKHNRFWIDPQILLTAQRECRDRGWNLLGVYHSHPDHPARPSERDRQLAWSEYSYPILSVSAQKVTDIRSWRLNEQGQFEAEAIQIVTESERL